MLDRLEDDPYVYRRKINRYYPFQDEGEWELGKFLVENLTQTQMIKFLKLKWFNTRERPSFTTKDQLLDWMDSLPCFMEWEVSKIEFSGYKTVHPVELIWRDALEVVKQLFGDPIFVNHMSYTPHIINVGNQCEYGDYMSTDMAWKIQDYLPVGATQVPIILGSDKTHVTQITGGLEMHPVFITIGNIDSEVRSKATLRAWRCIAYMPIAKFRVHPDYQSILQARLWHKCMDLVLANLKAAAADGCFMPDPSRHIHYVFTPLHTLQLLVDVSRQVDPWDLDKFQKAAKAVNLSGVHMRDWPYVCPSVFLAGEILHTCFKFFADHLLKWTKEVVGAHELDNRFIVQHKRVGTRHFAKGVTHVKQMMGREYREIQRTIVASIAGAAPPQFVRSICAIMEFIYLAQNPVHSPATLQSMEQALSDFHSFKGTIIEAAARKGKKGIKEDFFIPKLELLQSFKGTVQRLGTLMQFSANTTERLLITHCKDLFSQTSRQSKDFMEQCVRLLNCQESMEVFDLYALLTSRGVPLVNAMHAEEEEVAVTNPALLWVSRVLPDEVKSVHGPRPVRNHFLKGILSGDARTAFQVNVTPDYRSMLPTEICTKYTLPNFNCALANFIARSSSSSGEHACWDPRYGRYHAWNKFRLQLHSAFQQHVIMPSRVVQAHPPSDDFPFGNCDTVLIDAMGINGKTTSRVAQVRLVFQPVARRGSNLELPSYLSDPLLYIKFFRFVSSPDDQPKLAMWTVEHAYTQDQNGNRHREGAVVRVTDVTLAVELIPCFGEKVAGDVSSTTCLECYECFFLNNFADKESYHTFSTEFV
ncbi:uncharacterized protein EDB93DRAFT_1092883 [Suillus bovinus]|uniref:uncharacterized protein n=1 Tax=Suillus bovinus TaxID=48563 RepID=UPI001B8712B4|nr:uncharacterized protein EDB93DRAFT_1092883 [Suillus bovinus]KAG2134157.1 hypothetical protein EDB93DRAFT_1092883 [Suillus bovinus]